MLLSSPDVGVEGAELPVPQITRSGILPSGIHECTLKEAEDVFGAENTSQRRRELWASFVAFLRWLRGMNLLHLFRAMYLDGSFVTNEPIPGDIDVILELPPAKSVSTDEVQRIMASRIFEPGYVKAQFHVD